MQTMCCLRYEVELYRQASHAFLASGPPSPPPGQRAWLRSISGRACRGYQETGAREVGVRGRAVPLQQWVCFWRWVRRVRGELTSGPQLASLSARSAFPVTQCGSRLLPIPVIGRFVRTSRRFRPTVSEGARSRFDPLTARGLPRSASSRSRRGARSGRHHAPGVPPASHPSQTHRLRR